MTRSRYRLIFFDETNEKRKYLERQLINNGTIKTEITEVIFNKKKELNCFFFFFIKDFFLKTEFEIRFNPFTSCLTNITNYRSEIIKVDDLLLAVRYFNLEHYQQASILFEKANNTHFKKMYIFYQSNSFNKYFSSEAYFYKKMGLEEINEIRALENFNKAADLFFDLELKLNAAKCFYHGKKFKKACGIYFELGLMEEALKCGDSLVTESEKEKNGLIKKEILLDAAWCYEKCHNLKNMFFIYEKISDFQLWFDKLHKYYVQNYSFAEFIGNYFKKFTQSIEIDLNNFISEIDFKEQFRKKFEILPETADFQLYLTSVSYFKNDLKRITQSKEFFKRLPALKAPNRIIDSNYNKLFPYFFNFFNQKYYEKLAVILSLHLGYDLLYLINKLFKQKYLSCSVEMESGYLLKLDQPFVSYCSNKDLKLNGILINPILFLNLNEEISKVDSDNLNEFLNLPLNEFRANLFQMDFLKKSFQIFIYNSKNIQSFLFSKKNSIIFEKCLAILDHILTIPKTNMIVLQEIRAIIESNG